MTPSPASSLLAPADHAAVTSARPDPRLDVRLARAAVSSSIQPGAPLEDAADRLVLLAGGNRTAVQRALARLEKHHRPPLASAGGRAAAALRLALSRGDWSW